MSMIGQVNLFSRGPLLLLASPRLVPAPALHVASSLHRPNLAPTLDVDSCNFPEHRIRIRIRLSQTQSFARQPNTMRSILTLISALLAYTTAVYATALTYRLEAHENACFYAHVENKGTKLAFYFAVCCLLQASNRKTDC